MYEHFTITPSAFFVIAQYLLEGQKIQAIKALRDVETLPRLGLLSSKNIVEVLKDALLDCTTFEEMANCESILLSEVEVQYGREVATLKNDLWKRVQETANSGLGPNVTAEMAVTNVHTYTSSLDRLNRVKQ